MLLDPAGRAGSARRRRRGRARAGTRTRVSPRDRRAALAPDELLALERVQRAPRPRARSARRPRERAEPEDLAEHGRVLQQRFSSGRQAVEPRGDDALHGLGQLAGRSLARLARASARTARRRADCRRRARAAPPASPPGAAAARAARATSRAVSSSESGESEIVSAFGLPPPQPGRRSSSSGRAVQTTSSGTPPAQSTRWSTKSSRSSSAQCRSSKTSTSGRSLGERLEEAPPGRERLAARSPPRLAVAARPTSGRRCVSTQRARPVADERRRRMLASFGRGLVRRRPSRGCPACAFTISPSAQKRDALAVGQRAALPPVRSARARRRRARTARRRAGSCRCPGTPTSVTSCGERSCARARRARREQRRARAARPTSGASPRSRDVDAEARARLDRLPDADRLGLALGLDRLGLARTRSRCSRGAVRRLADEDPVHRRGRLQARGGVDDVAGGHALALGRAARRARRAPRRSLTPIRTWSSSRRSRDPVADRERGAHRPLGIVLVRDRRAEERHHRVADELLDRAAVALELGAQPRVVRRAAAPRTSSGSSCSARDVKPTRSAKSTVTTLRSSRAVARPPLPSRSAPRPRGRSCGQMSISAAGHRSSGARRASVSVSSISLSDSTRARPCPRGGARPRSTFARSCGDQLQKLDQLARAGRRAACARRGSGPPT